MLGGACTKTDPDRHRPIASSMAGAETITIAHSIWPRHRRRLPNLGIFDTLKISSAEPPLRPPNLSFGTVCSEPQGSHPSSTIHADLCAFQGTKSFRRLSSMASCSE
jgi:hypothetical protein